MILSDQYPHEYRTAQTSEDGDLLTTLSTHESRFVRARVAANPFTPKESLIRAGNDGDPAVQASCVDNVSTSAELVRHIASRGFHGEHKWMLRVALASNHYLTEWMCDDLLNSHEWLTLLSLAHNQACPTEKINTYLKKTFPEEKDGGIDEKWQLVKKAVNERFVTTRFACTVCSKEKRSHSYPLPAYLRYKGAHIGKTRELAGISRTPLLFLSGKLGFISQNQMVDYYDYYLDTKVIDSLVETAIQQLNNLTITHLDFYSQPSKGWKPYIQVIERTTRKLSIPLTVHELNTSNHAAH